MFQYCIYPTKKQASLLKLTLEECRWLYNETLAYRKNAWEQERTSVDWYDSKARIPLLKQDRPSLKLVHSQVLQNVTDSRCGHRQVMPLSKRLFTCPDCSLELDRDINASLNILSVGLHTLGTQPVEAPAFTHGE